MKSSSVHILFLAVLLQHFVACKLVIADVITGREYYRGNYTLLNIVSIYVSFQKKFQPCIGCTFHQCNHYFQAVQDGLRYQHLAILNTPYLLTKHL